jgi:hypothetical protein
LYSATKDSEGTLDSGAGGDGNANYVIPDSAPTARWPPAARGAPCTSGGENEALADAPTVACSED